MFRKKRKTAFRTRRRSYSLKGFASKITPRPNIRKSRPRRPLKISSLTKKISGLVALIALVYILFFSNLFLIRNITTAEENRDDKALSSQLENSIQDQIGKNLVLIDTEELTKKLLDNFPEIQDLKISKKYPATLQISFSQYELVANLINETPGLKKTYIINSVGYSVKEDLKSTALPTIILQSDEPLNTSTALIPSEKLKYIMESYAYFEEKFGMKVKNIFYKPTAREVHLLTEKDFYIWLDIMKSYEEQFNKLKKALVKLDIYNENLLYIDLRIAGGSGDKIIYKHK